MPHFTPIQPFLPAQPQQACLPIGGYDRRQLEHIRHHQPHSFLNVVFPEGTSKSRPDWYLSRKAWEQFVYHELYKPIPQPAFFVYYQQDHEREFSGLIGAASTKDFEQGRIRKHEDTLRLKAKTLLNYLHILRIQAEPVYLLFDDDPEWPVLLAELLGLPPLVDFSDSLGRRHILKPVWDSKMQEKIARYFLQKEAFYVADGHHRCAASALYGRQHQHEGSAGLLLSALLPLSSAVLEPFSRLVTAYQGLPDKDEIFRKLNLHFNVQEIGPEQVVQSYAAIYLQERWYALQTKQDPEKFFGLMGRIPSFVLNELVFQPIFEISDFRNDRRLRFVGGRPDPTALALEVRQGKAALAIAMQPVHIKDFRAVADNYLSMPPKSTWFMPKFLTGLTVLEYGVGNF